MTITGDSFTGATAVSFGGVAAASFTIVNATTINAVAGNGASGDVKVTGPGGTGTKPGFVFVPPPVITFFNPSNGTGGIPVTITGSNFMDATAVSFGGIAATSFVVISSTTITAVVSGTGGSGNVSVTTRGGTASLPGFVFNFPTGINGPANNNSNELTAYPNPSDDLVLIKHPASIKNAHIRFVDLLGREVKRVVPVKKYKANRNKRKRTVVRCLPAHLDRRVSFIKQDIHG
ncbi:MAG: IPT/TIG domain-containing protein [Bacteroidota bacterium]